MIAFLIDHRVPLLIIANALAALALCHVVIHDDAPQKTHHRRP